MKEIKGALINSLFFNSAHSSHTFEIIAIKLPYNEQPGSNGAAHT